MTTARESGAEPYQVMPALTENEYESLRESIRAHGVQVPVEYDEHGNILDGHHRLKALRELGLTAHPRVIRSGFTEDEKIAHATRLNLARRHLTPEARAEAVGRLRAQGWSIRRITEETGIPRATVGRDLSSVDQPSTVLGVDGKSYPSKRPTSVYVHSDHQQRLAETALDVIGDEAPAKAVDLRRLERMRRERSAADARAALATVSGVPSTADIRCIRIADLTIEPGTVDLLLTDPPYTQHDLAENGPWDTLGRQASQWLKPGGLLLAYAPHIHLDKVMQRLAPYAADGLGYWWLYAITFPGGGTGRQVRSRAVAASWRPVLAYRKAGGPPVPRFSADPVQGSGREKDSAHPWQQGVGEARTFISRLTEPGALVVDPFVGSGTIAIAAALEGRQVIAADHDPAFAALAQRRLAEALTGEK